MTAAYALRPVGRDSLRDQAYAAIRDGVLAGRFAPGERVTIRALAASLGTSPTPVREALNQLVAEGTFELLPNGSASIPAMTLDRFAQLRAMREALEGLAAERAAAVMTGLAHKTPGSKARSAAISTRRCPASAACSTNCRLSLRPAISPVIWRATAPSISPSTGLPACRC